MRLALAMVACGCGRIGFDPSTVIGDGDAAGLGDVTVEVDGMGHVVSLPAGIDCPGTCTATFPAGASVALAATADAGNLFLGWDGGNCAFDPACSVVAGREAPVGAMFTGTLNVAFATSSSLDTTGLTIAAADAECNARAAAVGLPGTYMAWLSTSASNAITRLGSASGWISIDGLPWVLSRADLTAAVVVYPLRLDELHQSDSWHEVTATGLDGTFSGQDCSGWTVSSGFAVTGLYARATGAMFFSTTVTCGMNHVLCLGTDHATAPKVRQHHGRIAFHTAPWMPGGGLASADAWCQQEAMAAGLSGTFRALLATSTATGFSRFDLTGPTWNLPSGRRIIADAAVASTGFLRDIDERANGQRSLADEALGSMTNNCADWTSSSSSVFVEASSAGLLFGSTSHPCSQAIALRCLED